MRILMLGNSFTTANDLPGQLAALTGAEVVCHTRGGARLSEHLNPEHPFGRPNPGRPRRGTLGLCGAPGDEPRPLHLSRGASLPVWSGSAPQIRTDRSQCRFSMPPGPIRRAAPSWLPRAGTMTTMARTLSEAYRQGGPGESRPACRGGTSSSMSAPALQNLYAADSVHPNALGSPDCG